MDAGCPGLRIRELTVGLWPLGCLTDAALLSTNRGALRGRIEAGVAALARVLLAAPQK